jgi:hypothetical protein
VCDRVLADEFFGRCGDLPLAHAEVSVTLEIYTHYIPGDDEDIAANCEKRLVGLTTPE